MPVKTQNEKLVRDVKRVREQRLKTKVLVMNKRLKERLAHMREY
jgi:hypothetical protein